MYNQMSSSMINVFFLLEHHRIIRTIGSSKKQFALKINTPKVFKNVYSIQSLFLGFKVSKDGYQFKEQKLCIKFESKKWCIFD